MKTVFITGASRGIGAETARRFAKEGYAVAVNYCRSEDKANALVAEIAENGGEAFAVKGDVAAEADVFRMADAVRARGNTVDVLIHNAGIANQGLFTDLPNEEWKRMMGVHLDGAYYVSRAFVPDMIRRHAGCVLFVSSMWGQTGASCEAAYSAAKAGLIGLSKALAKEWGPSGIRVNCVAPGVIDTDMCAGFNEETKTALRDETPLGRLGTPKEVADALFYLASDNASFITGQVLGVNGGFLT